MAKSNTRITADKDEVAIYTYEYTATSGQTTFSGSDDNSATLDYTAGSITVSYGGLELPESDYTATNGTSVVLADGAVAGEIIRVVAYEPFVVADTYTRAQADAAFLPINALTDPSFFRVHLNTNQSVSSSSYTKINFETVDADTDNAYSTSTYTWTPTVEGWYQVTTNLNGYASSLSRLIIVFRKNGDSIRVGDVDPSSATGDWTINGSSLVYMNGTTDSIYVDGYIVGSSATFRGAVHGTGGVSDTFFQAFLVKEGS